MPLPISFSKKMIKANIFLRQLYVRRRLFICILVGVVAYLLLPYILALKNLTLILVSWDISVLLYLILGGMVIASSSHETMRERARLQDEGALIVLTLTVMTVIASFAALIGELAVVKNLHGIVKYAHIALTILTLMSSWILTHMIFSFHYAHMFYVARDADKHGGLLFPEDDLPNYADFLYFSCIIGTSAQTADVNISGKKMRHINLVHCIIAFIFNTTILALTVNIASNLF